MTSKSVEQHRRTGLPSRRAVLGVVGAAVLVVLPYVLINTPTFVLLGNTVALSLDTASYAVVAAVAVLSMVLLVGRCGQLSLATGFFVGIGAYAAGGLHLHLHVNLALSTVGAAILCGVFGALLGLPALRIRGAYLALVTITLAAVLPALVRLPALKGWTGGSNGLLIPGTAEAPSWLPVREAPEVLGLIPFIGPLFIGTRPLGPAQAGAVWTYLSVLAGAALVFWLVAGVTRGRVGRALTAVRDHEIGAGASGVHATRLKVMVYGVSAAVAGVAGGMYVAVYRILAPDSFGLTLAIFLLFGLILGGQRSLLGAAIGGIAVAYLPFLTGSLNHVPGVPDRWLTGPTASLILGVLLVVLALAVPGGFSDPDRAARRRGRRAARPDTSTADRTAPAVAAGANGLNS